VVEVNEIIRIEDLGTLRYNDAWAIQEAAHADVLAGGQERIFLVEHPPVITFGRRPGVDRHLIASAEQLAKLGVEVVQSDRGGDITFHGPGQLVAYPIIRLKDHGLSVGSYVRTLEMAVIAALAELGVEAAKDPDAIGVWINREAKEAPHVHAGLRTQPAKICALGVRIRRGVSLHGIALNVTTDLSYFGLIVPCGLIGKSVTSLAQLLEGKTPAMPAVKRTLSRHLNEKLLQRD
jgi:lipoyl(octanoyl) transferase